MKISIIIPTIRSEKMVDFQLPSFAKQTFPKEEFEIIIIDDCPIDRKDQIENFGRANDLNIKWTWFHTSNVSAPLKDLIKINGFWEMADLTREEDVLMGYALEGICRKLCFVNNLDICVYHMTHDSYNTERKYKDITFKELGWDDVIIKGQTVVGYGGQGKNGLNTNPDQIQHVTRDIFGTKRRKKVL